MTSRQFRILIVLTVVSGFLGGGVSNLLLRGVPAAAQGAKVQDEVLARKFMLVDEAGKVRASLDLNTASPLEPELTPGLELYDAAGKWRAGLCLGEDGSPALALYDAAGKWGPEGWDARTPRANLGVGPDGSPGLTLNKADGEVLWKAP